MHNTKHLEKTLTSILRFMLHKYTKDVNKVSHLIKNSNYDDDCMSLNGKGDKEEIRVGDIYLVG